MADLKVTVKEDVILNGTQQGGVYHHTYTGITDVYKRIFTVPENTEVLLYKTHASQTEGSILDKDSIKYVRITNLSNTYSASVQITNTNSDNQWIAISPNSHFMLSTHASSSDASTGTVAYGSIVWDDITRVDAAGISGSAQIELFAASRINA